MFKKISKEMTGFLKECPTAFHAVARIERELEKSGYTRLKEPEEWQMKPGGKYYVTSPASSRFGLEQSFRTTAFTLRRPTVTIRHLKSRKMHRLR